MERCHTCWNLVPFCICTSESAVVRAATRITYEAAYNRTTAIESIRAWDKYIADFQRQAMDNLYRSIFQIDPDNLD